MSHKQRSAKVTINGVDIEDADAAPSMSHFDDMLSAMQALETQSSSAAASAGLGSGGTDVLRRFLKTDRPRQKAKYQPMDIDKDEATTAPGLRASGYEPPGVAADKMQAMYQRLRQVEKENAARARAKIDSSVRMMQEAGLNVDAAKFESMLRATSSKMAAGLVPEDFGQTGLRGEELEKHRKAQGADRLGEAMVAHMDAVMELCVGFADGVLPRSEVEAGMRHVWATHHGEATGAAGVDFLATKYLQEDVLSLYQKHGEKAGDLIAKARRQQKAKQRRGRGGAEDSSASGSDKRFKASFGKGRAADGAGVGSSSPASTGDGGSDLVDDARKKEKAAAISNTTARVESLSGDVRDAEEESKRLAEAADAAEQNRQAEAAEARRRANVAKERAAEVKKKLDAAQRALKELMPEYDPATPQIIVRTLAGNKKSVRFEGDNEYEREEEFTVFMATSREALVESLQRPEESDADYRKRVSKFVTDGIVGLRTFRATSQKTKDAIAELTTQWRREILPILIERQVMMDQTLSPDFQARLDASPQLMQEHLSNWTETDLALLGKITRIGWKALEKDKLIEEAQVQRQLAAGDDDDDDDEEGTSQSAEDLFDAAASGSGATVKSPTGKRLPVVGALSDAKRNWLGFFRDYWLPMLLAGGVIMMHSGYIPNFMPFIVETVSNYLLWGTASLSNLIGFEGVGNALYARMLSAQAQIGYNVARKSMQRRYINTGVAGNKSMVLQNSVVRKRLEDQGIPWESWTTRQALPYMLRVTKGARDVRDMSGLDKAVLNTISAALGTTIEAQEVVGALERMAKGEVPESVLGKDGAKRFLEASVDLVVGISAGQQIHPSHDELNLALQRYKQANAINVLEMAQWQTKWRVTSGVMVDYLRHRVGLGDEAEMQYLRETFEAHTPAITKALRWMYNTWDYSLSFASRQYIAGEAYRPNQVQKALGQATADIEIARNLRLRREVAAATQGKPILKRAVERSTSILSNIPTRETVKAGLGWLGAIGMRIAEVTPVTGPLMMSAAVMQMLSSTLRGMEQYIIRSEQELAEVYAGESLRDRAMAMLKLLWGMFVRNIDLAILVMLGGLTPVAGVGGFLFFLREAGTMVQLGVLGVQIGRGAAERLGNALKIAWNRGQTPPGGDPEAASAWSALFGAAAAPVFTQKHIDRYNDYEQKLYNEKIKVSAALCKEMNDQLNAFLLKLQEAGGDRSKIEAPEEPVRKKVEPPKERFWKSKMRFEEEQTNYLIKVEMEQKRYDAEMKLYKSEMEAYTAEVEAYEKLRQTLDSDLACELPERPELLTLEEVQNNEEKARKVMEVVYKDYVLEQGLKGWFGQNVAVGWELGAVMVCMHPIVTAVMTLKDIACHLAQAVLWIITNCLFEYGKRLLGYAPSAETPVELIARMGFIEAGTAGIEGLLKEGLAAGVWAAGIRSVKFVITNAYASVLVVGGFMWFARFMVGKFMAPYMAKHPVLGGIAFNGSMAVLNAVALAYIAPAVYHDIHGDDKIEDEGSEQFQLEHEAYRDLLKADYTRRTGLQLPKSFVVDNSIGANLMLVNNVGVSQDMLVVEGMAEAAVKAQASNSVVAAVGLLMHGTGYSQNIEGVGNVGSYVQTRCNKDINSCWAEWSRVVDDAIHGRYSMLWKRRVLESIGIATENHKEWLPPSGDEQ